MKTEGRRMLDVNRSKLRTGILNISSGKTVDLCDDSTTCCFPLTNTEAAVTVQDSRAVNNTRPKDSRKGLLLVGTIGTVLMVIASLVYVINPLQIIINAKLAFNGHSYLYHMWQRPPVTVYVKTYIFNVTNPKEFMAGAKMKLEEVGPFVYREELEHFNVSINGNNSVTYIPRRTVTWVPERSTHIPLTARLMVPNIPLIGFASMLANASVVSNIALASLASYLDSQPFLNLSVEEYLWGYEDSLVKLATNIFPHWIPFESFGLLDRMFDDGDNIVTMNLNLTTQVNENGDEIKPLTIDKYNGLSGLEHWGFKEENKSSHHGCNMLKGVATEGVLFPRPISKNDSFLVYRKAFCRTLPVTFTQEGSSSRGLRAYWYTLPSDVFDNTNPENSCYCDRDQGPCLPKGLSDMTTCIYGIPAAVSFPHFYQSDPKLLDSVEGMRPTKKDHGTTIAIQPDFGIAMQVHTRIQTNIIVRKTKYNPRVSRFSEMVLPIFWVDLCMEELPEDVLNLLTLMITIAPVLIRTVEYGFSALGAVMVAAAALAFVRPSRLFSRRGRRPSEKLWDDSGYRSVSIVPAGGGGHS